MPGSGVARIAADHELCLRVVCGARDKMLRQVGLGLGAAAHFGTEIFQFLLRCYLAMNHASWPTDAVAQGLTYQNLSGITVRPTLCGGLKGSRV